VRIPGRLSLLTAALLLHSPALVAAQAVTDPNIVAIFDLANTTEIESGTLARAQAQHQDVKDLGEMFAMAHASVRQQGRDLAKKLGVTPVMPAGNSMLADHQKAMVSLKTKKGAEFDKAWLDHEIAFHQAVIDAVTKTLLPATKNAELKAFEEKVAPAFVGHLEQAKMLRAKLGA
jgi:putative membrane protein